ncbi:hypothetical protein F2P79_005779 [Pimephales promelas]|nr:hypothetical protein F2P79_005779 [Pimephales promelas]
MVRDKALSSPVSSSMFTRLLFLWVTGALLLPLNWGTAFGSEEDEDMTPTPDYDYNNSTYDYYTFNDTGNINVNYELYEVLPDSRHQGNTGSVPVRIAGAADLPANLKKTVDNGLNNNIM